MILCDRCDNQDKADSFSLTVSSLTGPIDLNDPQPNYRVDLCLKCQQSFSFEIRKWLRTKPSKKESS